MSPKLLAVEGYHSSPGETRPDDRRPSSVSTPSGDILTTRVRKPLLPPAYLNSTVYLRSATPKKARLGSLNHPFLYLKKPIPLSIEREGDWVVASHSELEEFGFGENFSAAIEDFRQTLIELFLTLESGKKTLGPELKRLWTILQKWIIKK